MSRPIGRPAWLEIDLGAIEANIAAIRSLLEPGTMLMAVVKADGYGHGAVEVAAASLKAGAQRLGVALLEEALRLRQEGIGAPIHILSELPSGAAEEAVEHRLICTVFSAEAAEELSNAAVRLGKKAIVHMKVDTGMHRIGVRPRLFKGLLRQVVAMPNVEVEGCFTHFACADMPSDPYTGEQLEAFLELRDKHKDDVEVWHTANSAATMFFPSSHLDMVRIGIAMYGLQPSTTVPATLDLRPALSLQAELSYIQDLEAGEGVSYGLTYRAARNTRVGTVPLGYGDGYNRLLSNKASVIVAGQRCSAIGNICMDQFMVDLGDVPAEQGDQVTLVGRDGDESITLEDLAGLIGTINYEVACMLGTRLPRLYRA